MTAAQVKPRRPGTAALIRGGMSVVVGILLSPFTLAVVYSGLSGVGLFVATVAGIGSIFGALVGLVQLGAGLVERLLGGSSRPVDARRCAIIGAATPFGLALASAAAWLVAVTAQ